MGHHHGHRERGEHGRTVRARTSQETAQAASYLEALAQALRAGGVTIRSGAGLVALRTGDRVDLELEAGEEGRHSVVRLALRWETPVPEERLDITPGVSEPPSSAAATQPSASGQDAGSMGGSGGSGSGRSSSRRSGLLGGTSGVGGPSSTAEDSSRPG